MDGKSYFWSILFTGILSYGSAEKSDIIDFNNGHQG